MIWTLYTWAHGKSPLVLVGNYTIKRDMVLVKDRLRADFKTRNNPTRTVVYRNGEFYSSP